MLEVKKKDNESFESLIRGFSKKTVQSGKLLQAKKTQYHKKDLSKRAQKVKAIRRELVKDKKEYLRKIGKLDEILAAKKKIVVKRLK